MAIIAPTAKSMEYAIDGVADKLRFSRKMRDAELLAKAYAFLTSGCDPGCLLGIQRTGE
jgi:hypothetical protein